MTRHDLTGDGRDDLLVSSAWGLGLVCWDGTGLTTRHLTQSGRRLGGWTLDSSADCVEVVADVDGDGRSEALLTGPWGIGLARFPGGVPQTTLCANGTRVDGWLIDTSTDRYQLSADVDGDGRSEVLVVSGWGIGLLQWSDGAPRLLLAAENGTRLDGGWLLSTVDNTFLEAADVDGDGRDELVVTSPWGLGVIGVRDGRLTTITAVRNGTLIGSHVLDTATDRLEVCADLDADGRAELVLTGPAGLVVAEVGGQGLRAQAFSPAGTLAGEWPLDPVRDELGLAGDVDGDGRAELVVRSAWGVGVLRLDGDALVCSHRVAHGSRLGGWTVDARGDSLVQLADVDGDGRAELVVTGRWGLGIVRLDGSARPPIALVPSGSRIGGWSVDPATDDWGVGRTRWWALVAHHPHWTDTVTRTCSFLTRRGYQVISTHVAQQLPLLLARLARTARTGDRVVVYLAGHGDAGRSAGDYSVATAATHRIELGDGGLVPLGELTPSFELMADKGVSLVVIDGSCTSGETVVAAAGQRYAALSVTAALQPGSTRRPDPSAAMAGFGRPSRFGLWWSATDAASRMTGDTSRRFYEKVYRNDDTEIARWAPFYRPAVHFLAWAGWHYPMAALGCWLFEHVYGDRYRAVPVDPEVAAYRARGKVTVASYLATLSRSRAGHAPAVARLRQLLTDRATVDRAAKVYVAAYPKPWRIVVGDLDWDVDAEPVRSLTQELTTVIEPRRWAGEPGFVAMAAECVRLLDALETSWTVQTDLLVRLERRLRHELGLTPPAFQEVPAEVRVPSVGEIRRRGDVEDLDRVDRGVLLRRIGDAARRTVTVAPRALVGEGRAALEHGLTVQLLDRLGGLADRPSAELIARIRAVDASAWVTLDVLRPLLLIVEEALSRAQEVVVSPADRCQF